MIDITAPLYAEVELRNDGKVLWVNVDGQCALRICRLNGIRFINCKTKEPEA